MKDLLCLGTTTPLDEDCVQVQSGTDYMPKMRAEAQIFLKQLKRQFKTQKVNMRIVTCYHDFGAYLDIEINWNNDIDGAEDAAYNIENNIPEKWDNIAFKERLALDSELAQATTEEDEMVITGELKTTEISVEEVAKREGYNTEEEMILAICFSSVVPACCSEGCRVEPDGHCQHKNESVLLKTYII